MRIGMEVMDKDLAGRNDGGDEWQRSKAGKRTLFHPGD